MDNSANYEDGINALNLDDILLNNDPCLGTCNDALLDRIYIADDVLYIAGHNTLQSLIFMITCNINPTTHIPDASTKQLSWVKSLNGVQDFYAFAVNSTNAVACYKDNDGDIIITSCKLDADGKLDVYVDQDGNNIAVDSVTKGLSEIYTITSSTLAETFLSTDCKVTDIHVYNDNFYLLVNETNAAEELNVKYGDTLVSTGTILKLDSSLKVEDGYFSIPEVKSYSIQTSSGVIKNLKMKVAQSPADLNHFMGPNRILGVSDSGYQLIISDDGLYSWARDNYSRYCKWEHRIVIFNLKTAEIEYYIPVNYLYRGGSKALLGQIETYNYWTAN